MQLTYHHLMRMNYGAYVRQVHEGLSGLGLSIGQPKVLDFLYDNDGCVQKDIAYGCQVEPASVTSLLLKMEADGFVRRTQENGNRRSLHVYLTDKGKEAAEIVRRVMKEQEERALGHLSPQERETFLALMRKVHGGIFGER